MNYLILLARQIGRASFLASGVCRPRGRGVHCSALVIHSPRLLAPRTTRVWVSGCSFISGGKRRSPRDRHGLVFPVLGDYRGHGLALQAYSVRFLTAGSMFSPEPLVQWWVIAASLVILSAFPVLARLGGYRAGKPLPLMALELEVGGKKLGLTGLVDTGNNLRDPVSGLPVIVIDWEALQSVMPGEVFAFFLSTWDSVPASLPETPIGRRLRLIPYESLSGKKGVLPGFRPDWLALVEKDGVKVFKNAIVCASGERLCPSGLYQALLHPDLVNS